ncbi:MAG TPA: hypothetical protein VJI73_02555 [Candidatus Paceibacterota bacterium]
MERMIFSDDSGREDQKLIDAEQREIPEHRDIKLVGSIEWTDQLPRFRSPEIARLSKAKILQSKVGKIFP